MTHSVGLAWCSALHGPVLSNPSHSLLAVPPDRRTSATFFDVAMGRRAVAVAGAAGIALRANSKRALVQRSAVHGIARRRSVLTQAVCGSMAIAGPSVANAQVTFGIETLVSQVIQTMERAWPSERYVSPDLWLGKANTPIRAPATVDDTLAVTASDMIVVIGDRALAAAVGKPGEDTAKARAAEFESVELGRLQGRVEMSSQGSEGAFESEGIGRAAARLIQSGAKSPMYRIYCRWRAYNQVLEKLGMPERSVFLSALAKDLLNTYSDFVPISVSGHRDLAVLCAGLRSLLEWCRKVGFLASWSLELDPDAGELWEDGIARVFSFGILVEGDPFENAQVLLSDRRDSVVPSRDSVVPDIVAQVVGAWLRCVLPKQQTSVETYYADMRYSSVLGPATPGQVQVRVTIS